MIFFILIFNAATFLGNFEAQLTEITFTLDKNYISVFLETLNWNPCNSWSSILVTWLKGKELVKYVREINLYILNNSKWKLTGMEKFISANLREEIPSHSSSIYLTISRLLSTIWVCARLIISHLYCINSMSLIEISFTFTVLSENRKYKMIIYVHVQILSPTSHH